MDITVKLCNVCGRQKQETNHWFVVASDPRVPGGGIAFGTCLAFSDDPAVKLEDICGQECLHKRLNQWINAVPDVALNRAIQQEGVPA